MICRTVPHFIIWHFQIVMQQLNSFKIQRDRGAIRPCKRISILRVQISIIGNCLISKPLNCCRNQQQAQDTSRNCDADIIICWWNLFFAQLWISFRLTNNYKYPPCALGDHCNFWWEHGIPICTNAISHHSSPWHQPLLERLNLKVLHANECI